MDHFDARRVAWPSPLISGAHAYNNNTRPDTVYFFFKFFFFIYIYIYIIYTIQEVSKGKKGKS